MSALVPSIEKKALDLVELIYAAALDKQQWPRLIEAISKALDGQGGMLRLSDHSNQQASYFAAVGYEPGFIQAYRDYFITIDPYQDVFENTPVGALIQVTQFPNYRSIIADEFHNDFIRPQDKEYPAGATLLRDGDVTIQLGFQRSKRVGDFAEEDLRLLQLLLPHLTQAVQVHRLLGESAALADMAFASLDQAPVGVFLLDAHGEVVHINLAGERLLATGEIAVRQKRLVLKEPISTARLRQLIASVAQPTLGKNMACGGELNLSSAEGRAKLELRVIPLIRQDATADHAMQMGCSAVFVSRPGALRLPCQKVASSYGLSPAEAKLAVMIAEGCSLEEAADRLSVSINTVRSQLKSVFAKTGTRRQSELVAMLLRGVLAWCNAEEEAA